MQLQQRFQEIRPIRHLVSVAVTPVPVVKLRKASIGDAESVIFDESYETTITKHSLYSPGTSIYTNNDLLLLCYSPSNNKGLGYYEV